MTIIVEIVENYLANSDLEDELLKDQHYMYVMKIIIKLLPQYSLDDFHALIFE